jgi:hypothetical protein
MAEADFPAGWLNSDQYHPEQHLSKARKSSTDNDYLRVAERLVWFIREQRQMIAAGVAKTAFVIQTRTLVIDIQAGYATCETFIRDCLGNEATDIGTETRADFPDFPEKAATKSKGRALLSLGYGTAFAPELDEGERIVDTPVQRQPPAQPQKPAQPTLMKAPALPPPSAVPTIGAQCAALGHELHMDEKAYRTIVQSYTHDGKVNWQSVKSALETKRAEASLHDVQMERLHSALAAHPAD